MESKKNTKTKIPGIKIQTELHNSSGMLRSVYS